MSEEEHEGAPGEGEDPLLEEQEDKGYGADEGEREDALEQVNWERL